MPRAHVVSITMFPKGGASPSRRATAAPEPAKIPSPTTSRLAGTDSPHLWGGPCICIFILRKGSATIEAMLRLIQLQHRQTGRRVGMIEEEHVRLLSET